MTDSKLVTREELAAALLDAVRERIDHDLGYHLNDPINGNCVGGPEHNDALRDAYNAVVAEANALPEPPPSGDVDTGTWLSFLIMHAEHVHGCDHTTQVREAAIRAESTLDMDRLARALWATNNFRDDSEYVAAKRAEVADFAAQLAAEYARLGGER